MTVSATVMQQVRAALCLVAVTWHRIQQRKYGWITVAPTVISLFHLLFIAGHNSERVKPAGCTLMTSCGHHHSQLSHHTNAQST
jgi:hypothetical protein